MNKSIAAIILSLFLGGCFTTEPDYWGSNRKLTLMSILGEYSRYSGGSQEVGAVIQSQIQINNVDEFNKKSLVPQYPKFDFVLWQQGTLKMVLESTYVDEIEPSTWVNKDTITCFEQTSNLFRCPFQMIGSHADTISLEKGDRFARFSANYLFKVHGNGGNIDFYSKLPSVKTDTTIKAWAASDVHLFSGVLTYR